jgi:hypothetical protein
MPLRAIFEGLHADVASIASSGYARNGSGLNAAGQTPSHIPLEYYFIKFNVTFSSKYDSRPGDNPT